MKPLRIVFMGTPAFGLPTLEALYQSEHTIAAVYTQPDRPAGRGQHLQASPIKQWAKLHQIPIYQPSSLKDPQASVQLQQLNPDICIVIAYGLLLPSSILTAARLGCINVHASLLPRWRGASPIQQAIRHGDQNTGISIMQMDSGLDTGPVFNTITVPITSYDTAQKLHDKLSLSAPELLLTTLNSINTQQAQAVPQTDALATYAKKINKTDGIIEWNQPATTINCQIRAFNPWPVAYTYLYTQRLRIYATTISDQAQQHAPGTIIACDATGLQIATQTTTLIIQTLQSPGGKILAAHDWYNSKQHKLIGATLGNVY